MSPRFSTDSESSSQINLISKVLPELEKDAPITDPDQIWQDASQVSLTLSRLRVKWLKLTHFLSSTPMGS